MATRSPWTLPPRQFVHVWLCTPLPCHCLAPLSPLLPHLCSSVLWQPLTQAQFHCIQRWVLFHSMVIDLHWPSHMIDFCLSRHIKIRTLAVALWYVAYFFSDFWWPESISTGHPASQKSTRHQFITVCFHVSCTPFLLNQMQFLRYFLRFFVIM